MRAQSRFLWWAGPPLIRGVGRALFSLRIEHEAALPLPPFVVAANHYSHLDAAAIVAALDLPLRFLALEELFGVNRLLDWLTLGFGAVPTPRHRSPIGAIRTALAALEAGEAVMVFPEGTRVSHWGTLPGKRGATWLAIQAGVSLVPVAVVGTGRAMGLDDRVHRTPCRVVIGQAISPEGDATTLTRRWEQWMSSQIGRFPNSEAAGPRRAHQGGV